MDTQNSKNPLVSIIVPSYNHERFIKKTLESLFEQTYDNIELLIIDDCSTDATIDIIRMELKNYNGLHTFITKEKNKGVTDSLRRGILMSKGDYILPFSSDDILPPTAVKDRVDFLEEHKEYMFVHTDFDIIDDEDIPWYNSKNIEIRKEASTIIEYSTKYKESNETDLLKYMLRNGNIVGGGAVMWRQEANEIAATYDDTMTLCNDFDLWLRSLIKYKWGYLPKITATYRLHANNTYKSIDPQILFSKYNHQFSLMFGKVYDGILSIENKTYRDELLKLLFPYAYYFWFNDGNTKYEKIARGILIRSLRKNYPWSNQYSMKFRVRAIIKILSGIDIKKILPK